MLLRRLGGSSMPSRKPASCSCTRVRLRLDSAARQLSRHVRLSSSSSSSSSSLSFGPTDPPLLTQTIPQHFSSIVARFANRPAIIARSPRAPLADGSSLASPRETVLTYAGLDHASDVLARGLRDVAGVRRGDRVAVSLGNGPEFAVLTYAVYKLGALLVPLNPAFSCTQVAAALAHLGTRLLIIGAVTDLAYKPGRGRSNLPLLADLVGGRDRLCHPALQSPRVPSLQRIVVVDNTADHPAVAAAGDFARLGETDGALAALLPFSHLLPTGASLVQPYSPEDAAAHSAHSAATAHKVYRPGRLAADLAENSDMTASDVINIQFTSGTTAHPKAAMLPHRAILNNGALIAHQMGMRPTDRIVCPPPLFHCFGCILGYMATATTGAALLLPSPAFDPVAALQMAADHRASGLYGVATMFVAMLELLESGSGHPGHPGHVGELAGLTAEAARALPEHLRTGIVAGSSVPEALMERILATLGMRELVICYGMTETAPVSAMTTPADPLSKRTSTCGRVMPHTAIKIVDPHDRSRVVPRGQTGEIAVGGYLVMKEYYGEPELTAEVVTEEKTEAKTDGTEGTKVWRWMHSGDEGVLDADGFLTVTGRIKDLIIRGGENIHPLEIENCLFSHPLIAEVSVVGVPDASYGETVAAFVVPHAHVCVGGHGIHVDAASQAAFSSSSSSSAAADTLTDESVRDWVRQHMSSHLVPKHVFWTTYYPKTSSGKIQKYVLRKLAKTLLGESKGEEEKDRDSQ